MSDGSRRGGSRRAPKSRRIPRKARPAGGSHAKGGARALRVRNRRTRGLPGTLGMTLVGALFPGSGYLYAGRKALGALILVVWLVAAAAGPPGTSGTGSTACSTWRSTRPG